MWFQNWKTTKKADRETDGKEHNMNKEKKTVQKMITMIQSESITTSVRNSRRLNDSNIAEDRETATLQKIAKILRTNIRDKEKCCKEVT